MEGNDKDLIVAIIPARGGSKGVPKKNIKLLAGKPLIAYSIEAAKNSRFVDKVFVSTDSEEIAEVSQKYGAEIIYEREENRDQFDLSRESYLHYAIEEIEKKGIKIKLIVFLQATSPLRGSKIIEEAIEKIYYENYDSVLSVYPSFAYFGEVRNKEYFPFRKVRQRKQEMIPWYCDNGALYVIKRDIFDKVRNRYGGRIGVVLMSEEDSLQIDYPENWWLAEQIMKRNVQPANSSQNVLEKTSKIIENHQENYKSKKTVQIGNKLVGHDHTPFFIAEIGINHNGDMSLCRKMIDVAVEKGCDAVKFQKRTIELVYTFEQLAKPRESPWGKTVEDQKRGVEFDEEQYQEIDRYCKEKGIMWFASPWDVKSVDFLERFDVPCYKIASATLTNRDLLEKIKLTGKPIILSTGMSNMEQIERAVEYLGEDNLIILHCTSTYPSKDDELDLNVIKTLMKKFDCPIGYSGHEPGIWPSIIAVTLGACIVERHMTLGRYLPGSDQAASLEPTELGHVCRTVKRIPTMLGSHEKKVQESEKPIIDKLRTVDNL